MQSIFTIKLTNHMNMWLFEKLEIIMKNTMMFLKTLSDKNRLRILLSLMNKELCVCQLMGILDLSQSLISKHIAVLYKVNIVSIRKQGKLAYYSISKDLPKNWFKVLSLILESISDDDEIVYDKKSLDLCFYL
jgi:ArsR family transcriptional regulator